MFIPKTPLLDTRFFDPSNTWYIYDNKPLKENLERFAKFPISTTSKMVNHDSCWLPWMSRNYSSSF